MRKFILVTPVADAFVRAIRAMGRWQVAPLAAALTGILLSALVALTMSACTRAAQDPGAGTDVPAQAEDTLPPDTALPETCGLRECGGPIGGQMCGKLDGLCPAAKTCDEKTGLCEPSPSPDVIDDTGSSDGSDATDDVIDDTGSSDGSDATDGTEGGPCDTLPPCMLDRFNALHDELIAGLAAEVESGTYTPQFTVDNNSTLFGAYEAQWMRVGNVVTVSGSVTVTLTLTGPSSFMLTYPIASPGATNNSLCGGVASDEAGNVWTVRNNLSEMKAYFTNGAAGPTAGKHGMWYSFTYQIVP